MGVIVAIIVIIVVAVKSCNNKRVPPPQPYAVTYGRNPGVAMQPFAPGAGAPPRSYDRTVGTEAQPSAPPYSPYYKESFRYK